MNVLLIYPKFPDTFWSFTYALGFIGKKAAFPPLGLLTVASLLPAEWPRRLVDVNVNRLTDKDLSWADMAFIGGMAVQRESATQIIARCRASNVKVVAGGPLLLRELKAPEIHQPMNVQRFLSFFRCAFRLGVLGKERFHYWRLMLWTLIRKPRLMPVAITLSIYGYHYRKICELYIF